MKLLTNTKLALPILDDPSTRNTMSAATTSLHWPANRENNYINIHNCIALFTVKEIDKYL